MDLSIFFAGTGGSAPTARRGLPALLVRRGGDRILIDCGEGTQRQLVSSTGLTDLDQIYLTHFHADHWLGLPGMLKTFDLRGRERPLTIHGPPGLRALIGAGQPMAGRRRLRARSGGARGRATCSTATATGSRRSPSRTAAQRSATSSYEDERPGVFDPEAAARLGLVPGPEFGRVQRGETVRGIAPEQVMGPPRPGRKLVLSGDTRPCETLRIAAHRADVLVHEATFAEEERERAARPGTRPPPRRRRSRARPRSDAGAQPRLDAPPAAAAARRGARRVPATP